MSVRVLIADDSMYARMLLKTVLTHIFAEIQVFETASGQEALRKSDEEENDIDWYLLDINMGGPNGVETAVQLTEKGVDKNHIALVTGNRSSDLEHQATELGLTYIQKAMGPEDMDSFEDKLREFLSA
jgi:response regulator RpfG family c-di-GMP phosphodiesterase